MSAHDHRVQVDVHAGTSTELRTRDRLTRLLAEPSLAPWCWTTRVLVRDGAWPHSHPVLTLDTSATSDEHLLAAYLHEQLHWFEDARPAARDAAVAATRGRWPVVPGERPDGAGDVTSTRLHLLVCHWEHQALRTLLGTAAGDRVVGDLAEHHYRWVYAQVLAAGSYLARVSARFGLVPVPSCDPSPAGQAGQ